MRVQLSEKACFNYSSGTEKICPLQASVLLL